MHRRGSAGFTIIEAALGLIIGMIMIGSGLAIYFNVRVSAGNSKADGKTFALTSLIEEIATRQDGVYPTHGQLTESWMQRHDEAPINPWGGALTQSGGVPQPITLMYKQTNAQPYDEAAWNEGWPTAEGWAITQAASSGQVVYFRAPGHSSFFDMSTGASVSVGNYVVAIAGADGSGPLRCDYRESLLRTCTTMWTRFSRPSLTSVSWAV